ncbi:sensor domain-containing diguanylate cyclase [Roseateles albus]|uniref:diguanylate cyclase n=1 Tax=Roseateles albus TaxID=2987525 RepID=A0ABT5KEZ9_9BURK|nr:sensor domain-containing diguanylate cyclase [Roseateles albus]MDC8772512.1 sensor domain-containing diguanylate cyclase [Roseateles albus]
MSYPLSVTPMELFLTDEVFNKLEAKVIQAGAKALLPERIALAWHLRERDTQRALRMAEQLLAELPSEPSSAVLRLQLLRAEVHWLFADLDAAEAQALTVIQQAQQQAKEQADVLVLVMADAYVLLAMIAGDRGDLIQRRAGFDSAAALAAGCGDEFRLEFAQLGGALAALRQDLVAAVNQWLPHVRRRLSQPAHPALHLMCNEFLTFQALQQSDYATVFQLCSHTVSSLARAGMVRQVAMAMTTMGVAFSKLDDHSQALDWMQRALDLARPHGWPLVLGLALLQFGHAQRKLGALDAAQQALDEGLNLLAPLSNSRAYAFGLLYLAELQLDLGLAEAALQTAGRFEQADQPPRPTELRLSAMEVAALALSKLGRADAAHAAAQSALALAETAKLPLQLSNALSTLAILHGRHPLPAPAGMQAASPALHYLHLALTAFPPELRQSVPPSLYDAIAAECARLGDSHQAYAFGREARAASESVHRQDATKHAVASEAKFHAERAAMLNETSTTLERLSLVGQEITCQLQESAVYTTLDRHVHGLLSAHYFAVFLLTPDGERLSLSYGSEDGLRLAPYDVALSHPSAHTVRCALLRQDIFIDVDPTERPGVLLPATQPTLSAMFIPLLSGEQLLGVMSIQSTQAHAYADRERLIFRSLAAYAAIAIANARNYRQLEATLLRLNQAQAEVHQKNLELESAYQSLTNISQTDPLTGLRNRRFLELNISAEVSLTLRHYLNWQRRQEAGEVPHTSGPADVDLLFLLVDIDHFKRVNDNWGHPAGDAVLVQMRERLQQACRDSDFVVRWGGEEFLIVARSVSACSAHVIAERIRVSVAQRSFEIDGAAPLALSCSVGFAALPFIASQAERLTWQEVVGLADQALYLAKHGGRNAWVGLAATPATATMLSLNSLTHATKGAVEGGFLRIESAAKAE